jgi:hypothetical protein
MILYRLVLAVLFFLTAVALTAFTGCHAAQKPGRLQTSIVRDNHSTVTASFTPVHVTILPLTSPATTMPAVGFIPDAQGAGGTLLIPSTITETSGHSAITASGVNDEGSIHPLALTAPGVSIGTGGGPESDVALLGLNDNAGHAGFILVIAGAVVTLFAVIPYTKALCPIPLWVGPAIAAGGAAFFALPMLLDRYGWILPVFLGAVLIGALAHLGIKLGWFHRQTSPEKVEQLKVAGHHDAAGALVYLATKGDRAAAVAAAQPPPASVAGAAG